MIEMRDARIEEICSWQTLCVFQPIILIHCIQMRMASIIIMKITTGGNYLARLRHGGLTTNDKDHFQGIVSGDLKIWQGLKLRGVVGYDIISEHRLIKRRYYPVYKYLNKDQIANAGQSKNYSIQGL